MSDGRLWAPWRAGYVSGQKQANAPQSEPAAWHDGADRRCFVCQAAAKYDDQPAADRRRLVVERRSHTIVLLNLYPYNNGHLLICPLRHVANLDELTSDEQLGIFDAVARFTGLLSKAIQAEGFNVGLNLGRIAGAGVPGHLHWHLVPRWPGDNNFMPVTADIRVISQSLESLWELLQDADARPATDA